MIVSISSIFVECNHDFVTNSLRSDGAWNSLPCQQDSEQLLTQINCHLHIDKILRYKVTKNNNTMFDIFLLLLDDMVLKIC